MLVYNNFEWDVRAAAASLAAHGVTFKEASTVLAGDGVAISEDPTSGHLRAVGLSSRGRVLVVLHRRGPRIQILAATLHTSAPAEVALPEPVAAEVALPEPAVEMAPPEPAVEMATPEPAAEVVVPSSVARRSSPRRPVAPSPAAPSPTSAEVVAPSPVAPAPDAADGGTEATASDRRPPGVGWTAEAYGIYWEAYSAARQAARKQGKSHREAQRLGRVAGERAVLASADPPPR